MARSVISDVTGSMLWWFSSAYLLNTAYSNVAQPTENVKSLWPEVLFQMSLDQCCGGLAA